MSQFTLPKSPKEMMPAKKVQAVLLKQDAAVTGEKPLKLGKKGPVLLDTDKDKK
jgi:hypothetical protein